MGKVSIVVPVFNRAALIDRTVDSVTRQTHTDWELLLVDDGSTDDSLDKARSWARYDSRIYSYSRPSTRAKGANASRNEGLSRAQGEYVLFLDSDDQLLPDALEYHLRQFDGPLRKRVSVTNAIRFDHKLSTFNHHPLPSEDTFLEDFITKRTKIAINCVLWPREFIPADPFDETIHAGQDFAFHLERFINLDVNEISFSETVTAVIAADNESITRAKNTTLKNANFLHARNVLFERLDGRAGLQRHLLLAVSDAYWNVKDNGSIEFREIIERYEENARISLRGLPPRPGSFSASKSATRKGKKLLERLKNKITGAISQTADQNPAGQNKFDDIAGSFPYFSIRVVLNIGGHEGRSTAGSADAFPAAKIFSIEPVSTKAGALNKEPVVKHASDSKNGASVLPMNSLDEFAEEQLITRVDYLSMNSECSEMGVLKGSENMLREGRIRFIEMVVGMNPENQTNVPLGDVQNFLDPLGYRLFGLYDQSSEEKTSVPILRRSTAIFVHAQSFLRLGRTVTCPPQ